MSTAIDARFSDNDLFGGKMTPATDAVLIVGGYGVVGQQIAECIRQQHPDLPLIIAGRSPSKGEAIAGKLAHTVTAAMDVTKPRPLGDTRPRAIICAVNDPADHLLSDAIRNGVPLLDITRWTELVRTTSTALGGQDLRAPVLLSSGWMAGVASVVAVAACRHLERVASIDISVLYSLKDKAGPNSAEYMDRLATPFDVMKNGVHVTVLPYSDPRSVTFPDGRQAKAYRFDTPDQLTLPRSTGAATVSARIAFDSAATTWMLVALIRSGAWKLIGGDRFTGLRRALLYNPGPGASHQIVIDVKGTDQTGAPRSIRSTVSDPLGQTHLTAVGALVQLQRLLGLDGAAPPARGLVFPDTAPQTDAALQTLARFGVSVTMD
jgi:hypothetical protein